MPRNVSDIYYIPPGTEGFPDTTIESEKYNNYIHDVETDLNRPRPISAGGTGATSADGALTNLSAEKANQAVSNFDTHPWMSGSFNSNTAALGSPVAGHAFAGIVYKTASGDFAVEARDASTGFVYTRVQSGGVWSLWGRTDAPLTCADDPPTGFAALDNSLWFESSTGLLYVRYNDGDSSQWCIACPQPDISAYINKTGDTMTGNLSIDYFDPRIELHKATGSPTVHHQNAIAGYTANQTRWTVYLGNGAEETGGNAGSDFQISPHGDDGLPLVPALVINRATRAAMTGDLTVTNPSAALTLNKTGGAALNEGVIYGAYNGVNRWRLSLGVGLEGGSNSGSNFVLSAYDDAGAPISGPPLVIERATGLLTLRGDPTAPFGAATKKYVDDSIAAALAAMRKEE